MKTIYKGGTNKFRKGSKQYKEWNDDRDWWMNNLNLNIMLDYLGSIGNRISFLETVNSILKKKIDDLESSQFNDSL